MKSALRLQYQGATCKEECPIEPLASSCQFKLRSVKKHCP